MPDHEVGAMNCDNSIDSTTFSKLKRLHTNYNINRGRCEQIGTIIRKIFEHQYKTGPIHDPALIACFSNE